MAPLPTSFEALVPREKEHLADPYISSLALDGPLPALNTRSLHPSDDGSAGFSPIQAHDLFKRSTSIQPRAAPDFTPGSGAKPPTDFNNQGFLALFASIGGLMVLASLWFFFWSKNGGFKFEEGDWDDYKSTVLRRKGPDGKTLSNATKSTKLGGSTIAGTQHYKWAKQSAKSVVSYDAKGRKGIRAKRGFAKTHSILYSDDDYMTETFGTQTVSDMTEVRDHADHGHHSKRYKDRDVKEYKREKPARVGGLNRVADGSNIDTSYNGSDMSHSSDKPILQNDKHKAHERERAERRAREEAAKMERRWKKEAEEAAAALAQESGRAIPPPKKSVSPSKPSPSKQRQRSASRSASPKKRDVSYGTGPGSEVLSTAYTGTTSNRSASYYDSYRPRAESNIQSQWVPAHGDRTRQSSPKKKPQGGRQGGYRRGADDDLD
ncbi:hypothetical protein LTR37_004056 [Vermiconidia calcicola]|uniref:Uncharacterized protein n=1 Tax=Vermiconidia calcicola TaxID=1690605 RepID=A0ACC3NPQ8_9PEZI|nr:hypothetical protein LTR37_004056 [Vermiconidia calcicola]